MSPDKPTLARGAAIQFRTVQALIVRDLMMRYGRNNIGFIWVILEPLLLTVGVMFVWSLTMGDSNHGVKLVEFILTGYMPLTLWRHMTSGPMQIYRHSIGLLYHRTITLLDILAARQILEFIATSAALLVVWGLLYTAGVVAMIERLDLLLLGWGMMGWLAFGFGAIISAASEVSETSIRFINPIQYVMLPISGAFFMADWLPTWARDALLLNPMVHCYEVFRAGYFGATVTTHYDLEYFSVWALALTAIGLICVHRVRAAVQLQ